MAKAKLTTIMKKFYLDEANPDAFIELPVRPGKHTITLDRIEADVLHAKKGNSLACMNAECFKRQAAEGHFPHPVYGVVFDSTMAYVIDKITAGRQWKSAVRYRHNDRNGIKIHDKISPAEVIRRGKAVKTVILSPPLAMPCRAGYAGQNGTSRAGTTTKLSIPSGTRRRALEAGLIIPKAL